MNLDPSLAERFKPAGSGKRTKIRLSAWLLGLLAILFYFGFIAWNLLRGFASSGVY